jgi:di/tricarboxylate transporter
MTVQIAALLVLIVVALVLMALERFPADVTALGILLALILGGMLPPHRAFASFGNDAVIMIFCLLVLTAALVHTGVVDRAGQVLQRLSDQHPNALLAMLLISAAVLSAFISNTATTALLLPVTLSLARRKGLSASKLLMPLAFATILASSVTQVSSSTNVVISGLMSGYEMAPLGMFELAKVGLPVAAVGLLYMLALGLRWVPDRSGPEDDRALFGVRLYLAEIVVLPNSPLVGKTLLQSRLGHDMDLTVVRIRRRGGQYVTPQANVRLQPHDELLVRGARDKVLRVRDTVGLAIEAEVKLSDPELQTAESSLVEAIVLPQSPLIGRTLLGLNFRQRYGLQVLGINRRGRTLEEKLSEVSFRVGDQLLLQGPRSRIAMHDHDNVFQVLGPVEEERPNRARATTTTVIFGGMLFLVALRLLPLTVAALLGTLLVFLTRSITPERAYREVSWKALIVVGCMLAMGEAIEYTGTAAFLAQQISILAGHVAPFWLLSAFFVLTLGLTQPMSNQAAAVVVVPVAVQTAHQLGLNPRTFCVMIAVGASCSFITPLEPACLMVYGPGRYRFMDFVRVGAPLTLLIYGLAIALVPLFWPL